MYQFGMKPVWFESSFLVKKDEPEKTTKRILFDVRVTTFKKPIIAIAAE